jgi:Leucine-rich repeat (LRR) protein
MNQNKNKNEFTKEDMLIYKYNTELFLTNGIIKEIPPYINILTKINKLILNNNELSDISNLSMLCNLKYLSLYENKIKDKDISKITNLVNLTDLILDKNELTDISILSTFCNLKYLSLSENKIKDISKLTNLVNLKKLILNNNLIENIPNDIDKMINLRELGFENNKLETLPESLVKLKNLSSLRLNNNNLTHLPDNIGDIEKIKYLSLGKNKLTYLPKSILKIRKKIYIPEDSFQINNLSVNCKFIIIDNLNNPLNNIPVCIKKIYLYKAKCLNFKAPVNVRVFLDDIEIDL